jgi:hypothetical protein
MTESDQWHRAVHRARIKNISGLILMAVGGFAVIATSFAAIGWWTVPLAASLAVLWLGWWLATAVPAVSGPGSPGTPGTAVEVDTENPDPAAFIPGTPGSPGDEPGTFYPPPPSRDSSRDFERDPLRDGR